MNRLQNHVDPFLKSSHGSVDLCVCFVLLGARKKEKELAETATKRNRTKISKMFVVSGGGSLLWSDLVGLTRVFCCLGSIFRSLPWRPGRRKAPGWPFATGAWRSSPRWRWLWESATPRTRRRRRRRGWEKGPFLGSPKRFFVNPLPSGTLGLGFEGLVGVSV